MQKVYIDSRGYAWYLIASSTSCYRRAIGLPGRVGVIQLLNRIETSYDQETR